MYKYNRHGEIPIGKETSSINILKNLSNRHGDRIRIIFSLTVTSAISNAASVPLASTLLYYLGEATRNVYGLVFIQKPNSSLEGGLYGEISVTTGYIYETETHNLPVNTVVTFIFDYLTTFND